ncbi:MAG: nucleoside monophosphate kinase [Actinomycetota bacterium]|nr:nucleoside monophosphate kinase [Actinomycetota bacterium]
MVSPTARDARAVPARRIVLLARPGAGKSTQAALLATRLGVPHLSTGAMLRDEVASGSALGQLIAPVLERGDLVADELVVPVIAQRLDTAAAAGGYVLDGFPRDLAQDTAFAEQLPGAVQPQAVVLLDVPAEECRRRLLARAALEGRSDDTPQTIEHRLALFDTDLVPVIERYERRGLLVRVDGEADRHVVTGRILDRLGTT